MSDFQLILNQYLPKARETAVYAQYLELLLKWNKTFNLTAITDPKSMVLQHILDSLSVNPYLKGERIVDVGTGAGLPGMILAIKNPDKEFTLLDSNGKKTRFLVQAKAALGLKNVHVIHSRAEQYLPDRCFDTVISRAFASVADMLHWTQHLVCDEGIFLAMKGGQPDQELNDLPNGFKVEWVKSLNVPALKAERHLVCVRKMITR